ncbi:biotin--[acetyl-CoA-carboxylase] ligase [Paenibacillus humicola]|uniref:biotin--[acetyl-CoA-carboxylase] ligase n=1 Tax=Paenibacillus humicola TaxID=3110540 RepID=UPI00237AAFDB|nr:biotin--[acetyl-CoA-carboxylase] ligase [Paenibacillus humicola]
MNNRIIELLERMPGAFVSGETISKELQISRTAVWKQIRKLETLGYTFEASRRLGYRLVAKPSKLSLEELTQRLGASPLAKRITLLDTVDSTQNVAQRLAEDGAPEGTLVLAEQQTSGRGRMGRHWVSPSGKGIWMSLVLRPDLPLQLAPQLTLLAAVALCRALKSVAPVDIGIKWPNDLLIGGKKISGILLESTADEERIKYVVAGIGISLNLEPDDYPDELKEIATSLRIEAGRTIDRTETIAAFIGQFSALYDLYRKEGFAPIRTLWEALSVTLNKPVRLNLPSGAVEGTPIGLDERGALLVRRADGSEMPVFSAETIAQQG